MTLELLFVVDPLDELKAYHRKWFHPANFVISASGDFDRTELLAQLDRLFSDWPFAGEKAPPVPVNTTMAAGGVYLVNKPEANQGRAFYTGLQGLADMVFRDHASNRKAS